jgi:excisionase family DNA binding protein
MTQSGMAVARGVVAKGRPPTTGHSLEEHFSPVSLARRLECSVAKIRKSIWLGELDAVRVGRLVRIPASSVQRWLGQ